MIIATLSERIQMFSEIGLPPLNILARGPKGKASRLYRESARNMKTKYPKTTAVNPANVTWPTYSPLWRQHDNHQSGVSIY
jgi:hypothetical protein